MEFELLTDQLEWEVKRIAFAFDIYDCPPLIQHSETHKSFKGSSGVGGALELDFFHGVLKRLELFDGSGSIEIERDVGKLGQPIWYLYDRYSCRALALMARALYRLDFEDEAILAELNHPLTAHEKLELRLSLPREFWPKTWRDEQGE